MDSINLDNGTEEVLEDEKDEETEEETEESRQTSDEDSEEGTEEGTEEETEDEKPDEPDWESDKNPYKKKYTESSGEVQNTLLPKIKGFEDTSEKDKKTISDLQATVTELQNKLKETKPETYDNLNLKKQLDTTNQRLAEVIENSALDGFISGEPLAKDSKEKLRTLARANPKTPLETLWNDYLKAGAEAKQAEDQKSKASKKKSKTETGDGSPTSEPSEKKIAGKYTEEEFNKLPVMKRREILQRMGQKL